MTDRFAVNCSILFTELPVLDRPAAAKAVGFDAVEVAALGERTGYRAFNALYEEVAR